MTDRARRISSQFRRRRFNKGMMYQEGRFDPLTEYADDPGVFFEGTEWHDMRAQAGLVPMEKFGELGKDGVWREHVLTTSGRMLGWLSATMKWGAISLLRWAREEFNKSRWR